MATLTSTLTLDEDIKLVFEWQGGAYIEVREPGRPPIEVVNVWDYAAGKARIPFTQGALKRICRDWVGEYPREALAHDVKENWRWSYR